MSLMGDIQAAAVKWEQKLHHIDQGETASLVLVHRGAGNALVDGLVITQFCYSEEDIDGATLPIGVNYELRIPEELLTDEDLKGITGIRHGNKLFRVLQPSPYYPSGECRIWRFSLANVEKL